MNRKQIENLYMVNGLKDKLKNTDNLLNIHGIDFKEVNGYDTLDDTNKTIFKRFIINFFNAWGLENRVLLFPKGIYWVKEIEYLAKDIRDYEDDDEYFISVKTIIFSISTNGLLSVLHKFEDDKYINYNIIEKIEKYYLRFELLHDNKKVWYHVVNEGNDWY